MSNITLHAEGIADVTVIPNTFIDQYMPSANGAYVKVYLYLLRCFQGGCFEVTVSSVADQLENTEKDIIRALTYWEKLNILALTRSSQKELTSIRLIDLCGGRNEAAAALSGPDANTAANPDADPQADADTDPDTELDDIALSIHTQVKPNPRQSYPAEKIAEFTGNDEIKWAMHIVEIYLDRPLKPMDLQLILYLYEELHFSCELIMYLYEYCVSKGKKNASYIEAVALTWAKEGIDTEEKAKEAAVTYNEHYNAVNRAFGLNRAPGQIERQYINKWVEVFGFSDGIITEACNRALLKTQKPDFKYTDKILEAWFKKKVKGMDDIARLDEEFNKTNNSILRSGNVKTSNKFNQFPQRTYTAQDYADLERKLVNKGL